MRGREEETERMRRKEVGKELLRETEEMKEEERGTMTEEETEVGREAETEVEIEIGIEAEIEAGTEIEVGTEIEAGTEVAIEAEAEIEIAGAEAETELEIEVGTGAETEIVIGAVRETETARQPAPERQDERVDGTLTVLPFLRTEQRERTRHARLQLTTHPLCRIRWRHLHLECRAGHLEII